MSQRDDKPDFVLHGMMDLGKSVQSFQPATETSPARRIIYGEISNPNKDEEEERLIQKSLDFSYFDTNGWIKYEHEPRNSPKNIIGCPHERVTNEQATLIKGALLEGTEYADESWALIEAIEKHNRAFPEYQKCLGWSVEGNYMDGRKAKGGTRKAKVVNVVITPNAINKSTWLQKMEENHSLFAKSLAATPTSTVLPEKQGVDAIAGKKKKKDSDAEEDVDKKVKQTAEGGEGNGVEQQASKKAGKSTRRPTMKSYDDALQFYIDNDVDEDEAERLAKAMFPDDPGSGAAGDGGAGDEGGTETVSTLKTLVKSIGELKDRVFKAAPVVQDPDDPDPETDDLGGDEVDVSEYLAGMEKSISGTEQTLGELIEYTHDRDQIMAKAFAEVGQIGEQVAQLRKALFVKSGENEVPVSEALVLLLKARSGQPVDLSQFQVAGEGTGNGSPAGSPKKLPFGEFQQQLQKGLTNKNITTEEMARAEALWRTGEMDKAQAILDKCA